MTRRGFPAVRHSFSLLRVALPLVIFAGGADAQVPTPTSLTPSPVPVPVVPVLLVPGWGDDAADLGVLRDRLLEAGWAPNSVSAMSFQDPVGSSEANAIEVARAVDALLGVTGAPSVDVVAHSMGGLAVRSFLVAGTAHGPVRRVVFLGTPHRGTIAAALAWGDGGREMFPGSAFLARLNAGPPSDLEMLSVRTPLDTRVIPGSSAMLPGAQNIEICCPSHPGLLSDPEVFEAVRQFLQNP